MKRLVLMLVLSCLAMGMAYGQRKQRTEDWNKETSVGKEIPGKKIFGYIVGENGDLIYDGPCTITCTLPYTKVYEPSGLLRYGSRLYDDYEHKGEYKWQGNYKKGLLDGAISIEGEYSIAGEWADHFTAFRFIDYTTISYSFALSGKFTGGVPNGSFSVVQDGEEVLDATYKDGALVGYFYCYEHHGNISDGGKLTGEWVVDRYVEMEFIEGVLLSKTTSQRSTRPADVELARKYAKGEITKQELWDKHFIMVRTASIDLGSCARAIIMSETYDLPHFNDKENIFYYEYLDCVVEDSVIRAETFKGDKELTSITIPNSVTGIGDYTFSGCSSLTSITIPNSVTSIGYKAFDGCSSLTSVTIPNSITSIGDYTFSGCSSLTSVTIPNSITSIGDYTFSGCSSLTSITIPNSVTSIGRYAFYGCSSLTSITIPNSVTSIEWNAFRDCSGLKSVKVSNKYCYDYFKNLGVPDITFIVSTPKEYEEAQQLAATKLAIDSNSKYASKDGLCLIDNGKLILFIGKDLTEYTIPDSVTSIGSGAFKDCSSLKSVKVANKDCYDYFKDNVANITFYGANASDDGRCLILDGKLERFSAKGVAEYTIPESITSIGDYAFKGCSSLKSITIPNSVTSIGGGAFEGCRSLTSITIPNGVTEIGNSVFNGCSSLTSITIPNSVTGIGRYAFARCSGLTSITCLATTPPAIDYLGIAETTMIYVPKEAVKAYKQDPKWSRYKKQIKAIK